MSWFSSAWDGVTSGAKFVASSAVTSYVTAAAYGGHTFSVVKKCSDEIGKATNNTLYTVGQKRLLIATQATTAVTNAIATISHIKNDSFAYTSSAVSGLSEVVSNVVKDRIEGTKSFVNTVKENGVQAVISTGKLITDQGSEVGKMLAITDFSYKIYGLVSGNREAESKACRERAQDPRTPYVRPSYNDALIPPIDRLDQTVKENIKIKKDLIQLEHPEKLKSIPYTLISSDSEFWMGHKCPISQKPIRFPVKESGVNNSIRYEKIELESWLFCRARPPGWVGALSIDLIEVDVQLQEEIDRRLREANQELNY